MTTAPDEIRAWLDGRGMTLADFAREIEAEPPQVTRWLNRDPAKRMIPMGRTRKEMARVTGLDIIPKSKWETPAEETT